jgi:hypothetical protein
MQLRDRPEIDGERQLDLLSLPQSEIARFDEHTRRTQVDRATQFATSTRNGDVDTGAGAMPRMQATFHVSDLFGVIRIHADCAALCRFAFGRRWELNLI